MSWKIARKGAVLKLGSTSGFQQFAGMTLGLIIILIEIRYKLLPAQLKWDWLLFVVYLSGILFIGLRPTESYHMNRNVLFGLSILSKRDFALNVAGFIPLGFLILPLLRHDIYSNKIIRLVAIAARFGFFISLVIETLQYPWILGRFSSGYDLVANTIGVIVGEVCYVVFIGRRYIFQDI